MAVQVQADSAKDKIIANKIPTAIRGQKYISLTTFRKTGLAVPTPVWFGEMDGKLYVMTRSDMGKTKRIRNNPQVRVCALHDARETDRAGVRGDCAHSSGGGEQASPRADRPQVSTGTAHGSVLEGGRVSGNHLLTRGHVTMCRLSDNRGSSGQRGVRRPWPESRLRCL